MATVSPVFLTAFICGLVGLGSSVELTFELPDAAKECFFEVIDEGVQSTVEFQARRQKNKTCKKTDLKPILF